MRRIPLCALAGSLVGVMLVATTGAQSSRAGAPSIRTLAGISVTARTAGLEIRLSLSHASYPQDALVKATVQVRNISHATAQIRGGASSCGTDNPRVEVLSPDGRVLYPPPRPDLFSSPCPPIPSMPLRPRKSVTRSVYAVLRSGRLRAVVTLGRFTTVPVDVAGSALSVRLTSGRAPTASVHAQPDGFVRADIRPPGKARGPLLYVDSARCPFEGGEGRPSHLGWIPVSGHRVVSPCTPAREWHGVAGWVGQPVVSFDYPPAASAHEALQSDPGMSPRSDQPRRGRVVSVRQAIDLCAARPGSRQILRVRGYYAAYPFFGPGPPATPITVQTGYLFDRKPPYPLPFAILWRGLLVYGPSLHSRRLIPGSGARIEVRGRLDCAARRLTVGSWQKLEGRST